MRIQLSLFSRLACEPRPVAWLLAAFFLCFAVSTQASPTVRAIHVANGGIQPQAAVDSRGVVHLVYFKGQPLSGDLFYVRSDDDGKTWAAPIRVNSQPNSAIATGTIRGAQIAVGRGDRLHVAWNGSNVAEPKGPGGENPMLYARLNDAGTAFEPQRNVITRYYGLDGGGSIAADQKGNVYVAWHAPDAKGAGEANRRVRVARSADEGKTFAPETNAWSEPTGACGCCGMKLFADSHGSVYALYRSATEMVHRDIYLLRSDNAGARFDASRVAPVEVGKCVMSSASITEGPYGVVAGWETDGQVFWGRIAADGARVSDAISPEGKGRNQKYPSLAVNPAGQVLFAWSEGTAWNKGGSIRWRIYDAQGKPIAGSDGGARDLPAWSLPAAFANHDGGFTILY